VPFICTASQNAAFQHIIQQTVWDSTIHFHLILSMIVWGWLKNFFQVLTKPHSQAGTENVCLGTVILTSFYHFFGLSLISASAWGDFCLFPFLNSRRLVSVPYVTVFLAFIHSYNGFFFFRRYRSGRSFRVWVPFQSPATVEFHLYFLMTILLSFPPTK
jgi:hypothetical protein